jgi:hypothetical protein
MELRRKHGYRDLPAPVEKYIGPEYALSYACFTCRTSNMRHFELEPCRYPKSINCPVCNDLAIDLGRNFKPPKKSDIAQWKKVEFLVEHGFLFQKIRPIKDSFDSVPYPDTFAQAKDFVVTYKRYAVKTPYNKPFKQDF